LHAVLLAGIVDNCKHNVDILLQVSGKSYESLQFVGSATYADECTELGTEENWSVIMCNVCAVHCNFVLDFLDRAGQTGCNCTVKLLKYDFYFQVLSVACFWRVDIACNLMYAAVTVSCLPDFFAVSESSSSCLFI